jgi:hypothetical protein
MRIERDDGARAEPLADDEVRRGNHAVRADRVGRHRMPLDGKAEVCQEGGGSFRMRRAVARRIVRRNLHELRKKTRLRVALPCEKVFDRAGGGGGRHRRSFRQPV